LLDHGQFKHEFHKNWTRLSQLRPRCRVSL